VTVMPTIPSFLSDPDRKKIRKGGKRGKEERKKGKKKKKEKARTDVITASYYPS